MTRDYIIKMALESGFKLDEKGLYKPYHVEDITPLLERFAALVAAAERERCSAECERMIMYSRQEAHDEIREVAKVIRAMRA